MATMTTEPSWKDRSSVSSVQDLPGCSTVECPSSIEAIETLGSEASVGLSLPTTPTRLVMNAVHVVSPTSLGPPTLKRNRSACSSRRSIFSQYWSKRGGSESDSLASESMHRPTSRARVCSISVDDANRPAHHDFDVRTMSAPAQVMVHGEHFQDIRHLSVDSDHELPPIPFPLQRFYKDGSRTALTGMYPMNSPTSILRKSSYGKNSDNDETRGSMRISLQTTTKEDKATFNLTKSVRRLVIQRDDNESACSTITPGSHSELSTRFDPRVTITEFEDNVPRLWWTADELEDLQKKAIELAKAYLLENPEFIEKYSQGRMDPITGTLRKTPLFTMPVFSVTDSEDNTIESILLVDPNEIILQLFRRSLLKMFPGAEVCMVSSGKEAWDAYVQHGPFDMVVTEQLLSDNATPAAQPGKSSNLETGNHSMRELRLANDSFSGAVLLNKIRKCAGSVPSLLVGVTGSSNEEKKLLVDNGADLVWGKPPPLMDHRLRMQLVQQLTRKREAGQEDCRTPDL